MCKGEVGDHKGHEERLAPGVTGAPVVRQALHNQEAG